MNLGERIYELRTGKGMSQGDLAEALDVSRQSISKWETNGSVPELDKLIKLSEMFGVSLDELVLQRKQSPQPAEQEQKIIYVERPAQGSVQKTVGVVLLCFAALLWLMLSLLGDLIVAFVLVAPFATCGLICLLVKKHAGLWCAWAVYLYVDIYMRLTTGVHWQFVFLPRFYTAEWTAQLIVAWCLLAIYAVLTTVTAVRTRKTYPGSVRGDLIGTVSGWGAYLLMRALSAYLAYEAQKAVVYPQFYTPASAVLGWVSNMVLTVALVFSLRLLASFLKKGKPRS